MLRLTGDPEATGAPDGAGCALGMPEVVKASGDGAPDPKADGLGVASGLIEGVSCGMIGTPPLSIIPLLDALRDKPGRQ